MPTPQELNLIVEDLADALEGLSLMDASLLLREKHSAHTKAGVTNLKLEISAESDYGDSCYANVFIMGTRMETEEEARVREHAIAQRQQWQEQRDRQQYEALKAKFG